MSRLIERLAELRRYLEHLRELRPRVQSVQHLRADLSLHNDVLFSLMQVCQLVIDMAAELASQRGQSFEDYTAAVRSLAASGDFPPDLVRRLEPLPGFRNVLVHEYVSLDFTRVIDALDALQPVEEFARIVEDLASRGAI